MLIRGRATSAITKRTERQTKAAGTRVGVVEDWRSSGGKSAKKSQRTATVRDGR